MKLTGDEATALAHFIAARQLRYNDSWLEWEDYPNLDQDSFDRLVDKVRDLALHHSRAAKTWGLLNIDAASLYERTTP